MLICWPGCVIYNVCVCVCPHVYMSEVTSESIQKSFEELVMKKYIDKVPKLDLVTPTVEPEKAK